MDNISFQSRIKITSRRDFRSLVSRKFSSVDYPWTIKQTACSAMAKTEGIFDCTAMGVTDGEKVLMFHICPTVPENMKLKKLEGNIMDKIVNSLNLDYLQGIILGGKRANINSPKSFELFQFMENILKKLHIEYSKFKGGDFTNDISYDSVKDEWVIGCDLLDNVSLPKEAILGSPKNAVNRIFEDVEIADCDELTW